MTPVTPDHPHYGGPSDPHPIDPAMLEQAAQSVENQKPLSARELAFLRKPGHSRLTWSKPVLVQVIADLCEREWCDDKGKLTELGNKMRQAYIRAGG